MTEERIERHEVVIDSEEGVTESHTHEVIDREEASDGPTTTTIIEKETVIEEEDV
jgi:hypothetical protein